MRDYCDAQAGFWLNSKFWSKFSRKPLSGIEDQKAPPPPILENFRFGMTKVYSGITPPHFGKLQIWDDQSLLRNTPPHFGKLQIWDDQSLLRNNPPHFGKLQIWHDQSLLWNTPSPPPISENFRFGMTKVYSGIPPPMKIVRESKSESFRMLRVTTCGDFIQPG